MSLFKRLRSKARLFLGGIAAAVGTAVMAVGASAESTYSLESAINTAGNTITEQFTVMVQTLIPVAVGVAMVGIGLFAIGYLFKMAKSLFAKAAG